MSPSWRKRVRIALRPDGVTLALLAHGLRPRPADVIHAPCTPAGGGAWRAPLAAADEALAAAPWPAAPATVIVSNHFVRYVLVPWSARLVEEAEQLALAQHCFSEIHGSAALEWALMLAQARAGTPRLAAAVDRELLAELDAFCARRRLRLKSVQPYFAAAFNGVRRQIGVRDFWFVAAEPGRLCLARAAGGRWVAIRSRRVGESGLGELAALVEREACLIDMPPGETPVFVHDAGPAGAFDDGRARALRPRAAASADGPLAMALAG